MARLLLFSSALALAALAAPTFGRSQSVGQALQEPILMAIDADPAGNTATSLGAIDACISVNSGDTFDVDIVIANITDMAGWQLFFTYDPSVLVLDSADVDMFVSANEGSRLIDLSADLPDDTGLYKFVVGDLSLAGASGSGTLARITAHAVGSGSSALFAEQVVLGDISATSIDDADGDTFFDGSVSPAFVYVDAPCPGELPTVTPSIPLPTPILQVFTPPPASTPPDTSPAAAVTPPPGQTTAPTPVGGGAQVTNAGEDGDGTPWLVIAGVGAGAAVVALAAGLWIGRLIRRP